MSTNKSVKVYRNPARKNPEAPKQYVPQYQLMGVEPLEYKGFSAPAGGSVSVAPPSTINPRAPKAAIRQPYAEATVQSPIGKGRGPLPNVGNNIEQTWSSVDREEIVDDIYEQLDQNSPMVDNNEFVSAAALGLPEETVMEEDMPELDEVASPPRKKFTSNQPQPFLTAQQLTNAVTDDSVTEVIKQLNDEEYLILVEGQPLCSGPMDYVQEQTKLLVFGEHEAYTDNTVSVDDIVVIKKIKIKVGVFLD